MDLDLILEKMEKEAKKRNAPIFVHKADLEPYQLLIATVLSARTRDEQTAKAVEKLFSKARTVEDLANLSLEDIEELIKNVGFYRVKARRIKKIAEILSKRSFPKTLEELMELPGVGRKTANIVLSYLGKPAIAVDTHVHRISNRLGIVKTKNPKETEEELKKIFPVELWGKINYVFVGFGQKICLPKKPICWECPVSDVCKKVGVRTKDVEFGDRVYKR
ncbi:MAG: endonuclease III [Archaeoglobaceae archaeon]|nr:endonuclease III [Archaeoglobaceae archaeon]MDW7989241.1 endonuclease III [Archaeoglobaceae archaeon]